MKFKNSDSIGQYSNSAQSPDHGFSLLIAAADAQNVKNLHSFSSATTDNSVAALENSIRSALDHRSHCISSILGVDQLVNISRSQSTDDFTSKPRKSYHNQPSFKDHSMFIESADGKTILCKERSCGKDQKSCLNILASPNSVPNFPEANTTAINELHHSMQLALPILGGLLSPSSFTHIPISLPQYYSNGGPLAQFLNGVASPINGGGDCSKAAFRADCKTHMKQLSPDSTHYADYAIGRQKVVVKTFSLQQGAKKSSPNKKQPSANSAAKNNSSSSKQYLRYKLLERKNRLNLAYSHERQHKIKANQNIAPDHTQAILTNTTDESVNVQRTADSSPPTQTTSHILTNSPHYLDSNSAILKDNLHNLTENSADQASTEPLNLTSQNDQSSASTPSSSLSKFSSHCHAAPCNQPPEWAIQAQDNTTGAADINETATPPHHTQLPPVSNYRRLSSTDQGSSSGEELVYGRSPGRFNGPDPTTSSAYAVDDDVPYHSAAASYYFGMGPCSSSSALTIAGMGQHALHHNHHPHEHQQETSSGGSTSSDADRYVERRRRNNEAAKRCRANRRALFELRFQRAQELEQENEDLKEVIERLVQEVGELKSMVRTKAATTSLTTTVVAEAALRGRGLDQKRRLMMCNNNDIDGDRRRQKRGRRSGANGEMERSGDEAPLDFSNKKVQPR